MTYFRRPRFRLRYDKTLGLLLISPWLLGLLLFKLLPILASLGLSFTDFYLLEPGETRFVGLDNYARLIQDEAVGYLLFATINVAIFTIPLQLIASALLATLLNSSRLKASTPVRTLFFLPSIIPGVAIAFMWRGFTDPNVGWLNRFILQPLGLLGFNDVYSDAAVALLFTISSLWSIGPGMLIMLGAMQGISSEIMEAARVDGAGPLVRFFKITLHAAGSAHQRHRRAGLVDCGRLRLCPFSAARPQSALLPNDRHDFDSGEDNAHSNLFLLCAHAGLGRVLAADPGTVLFW